MSWQLLTAINVIAGSALLLLQRVLLHKDRIDPIAFVVVSQGLTAMLIGTYAVIHGFHLPDLSKYWFPITAMFGLYSIGHVIYAKTLKQVEASIFATLLNTKTIWIVLMGYILFQEHPTVWQLLGALLIFASVGMLAERAGKLKLDKSIWMGLLTGLIFGLAVSAWVYVGKHADLVTWTALSFAGTPLIVFLTNPGSVPKIKPLLRGEVFIKMALLAVFFAVSNLAGLAAFQRGDVSLVAPLAQTNVILTVLLAVIFLRERTRLWQKILAAFVCFIGVLLIIR